MNQIPEEIRNILFPEFLMKELSNLENCKEGCQLLHLDKCKYFWYSPAYLGLNS